MKIYNPVGESYNETKAFSYLAKVSDEKKVQSKEILKEIKTLKDKNLILDVGAGSGDIFLKIEKKFKNYVAIEPGEKMFKILKKLKNPRIKLFNIKWNEFYKKYSKEYEGKFDMIILVHAIYFLKNPKGELNKMMKLLKKGGKLIIIIGGSREDKNPGFITTFRTNFIHRGVIGKVNYNWIDKLKGVKIRKFPSKIKLTNFDKLKDIHKKNQNMPTNYFLKFALKRWFDEYSEKEIVEMKEFIRKNEKIDWRGNYILNGTQKMYILKK
jgi:SAM-dependent methyltransferase